MDPPDGGDPIVLSADAEALENVPGDEATEPNVESGRGSGTAEDDPMTTEDAKENKEECGDERVVPGAGAVETVVAVVDNVSGMDAAGNENADGKPQSVRGSAPSSSKPQSRDELRKNKSRHTSKSALAKSNAPSLSSSLARLRKTGSAAPALGSPSAAAGSRAKLNDGAERRTPRTGSEAGDAQMRPTTAEAARNDEYAEDHDVFETAADDPPRTDNDGGDATKGDDGYAEEEDAYPGVEKQAAAGSDEAGQNADEPGESGDDHQRVDPDDSAASAEMSVENEVSRAEDALTVEEKNAACGEGMGDDGGYADAWKGEADVEEERAATENADADAGEQPTAEPPSDSAEAGEADSELEGPGRSEAQGDPASEGFEAFELPPAETAATEAVVIALAPPAGNLKPPATAPAAPRSRPKTRQAAAPASSQPMPRPATHTGILASSPRRPPTRQPSEGTHHRQPFLPAIDDTPRDTTPRARPTKPYPSLVASLRREIAVLRGSSSVGAMGSRAVTAASEEGQEEVDEEEEEEEDGRGEGREEEEREAVKAATRVLLDRQKKEYQILVAKLRREVRRLRFQRNSLADPLVEIQYFPHLPHVGAMRYNGASPPMGVGMMKPKSADYFPLNPPPPTGNHPDGGARWWWGPTAESDGVGAVVAGAPPRPTTTTTTNAATTTPRLPPLPPPPTASLPPHTHHNPTPAFVDSLRAAGRVYVHPFPVPTPSVRPATQAGRARGENGGGGMVKYVGAFDPQPHSGLWCGIKLDRPLGNHDGVVKGKRYFSCEEHHGLFVRVDRIESVLRPKSWMGGVGAGGGGGR
ncbi:hypothetical protein DFJ73DRAFT_798802 [Zopfochytrium polystomum]|nr:hypothetical protein DFJ73DRAFT_798802 [Zopfochytrium polystomum]